MRFTEGPQPTEEMGHQEPHEAEQRKSPKMEKLSSLSQDGKT